MNIEKIDKHVILVCRKLWTSAARVALATVFIWFGALKVIGLSPAGALVEALYEKTLPFIPFDGFYLFFGLLEVLIGALFLYKKATRVVIPLLFAHMFTTALPLLLLPATTWQYPFAPTLEGQYIIKNLVIIAAALGLIGELRPLKHEHVPHLFGK